MSQPTHPDLFRPRINDSAVVRVAQEYGELLADPRWSTDRKKKLSKLRKYAQALTGGELEMVKKYWPDLLTN